MVNWKERLDIVAVVCGVGFSAVGSTGVAIAIIPHALAPLDVPNLGIAVGLIVSGFNCGQLVGGPPARAFMSRFGLQALLGVGLIAMLGSATFLALGPVIGLASPDPAQATVALMVVGRLCVGLGTVCATNAALAIMLDEITKGHAAVMACFELSTGLGSSLGPIIAASVLSASTVWAALLVSAVFVSLVMPCALYSVARSRWLVKQKTNGLEKVRRASKQLAQADARKIPPSEHVPESVLTRQLVFALAGVMLTMILFGVMNGTLILHLLQNGVEPIRAATAQSAYAFGYSAACPLAGALADRWATRRWTGTPFQVRAWLSARAAPRAAPS